jgi:hypothetical protein
MADITKYTQADSATVQAIYAYYKRVGDAEPQRGYLGASIIGHECDRYLWYCFRQCCKPEISGRVYRLFKTGQLEEKRLLSDLANIGCEVYGTDLNGNQFAVSALSGHFSGHLDACILGLPEAPKTWHVGEFKTHNTKSFKIVTQQHVQSAKMMHYAQMQVYMLLSGMNRTLYLCVNKDTDKLYSERVKLDKAYAKSLIERAERIISTSNPTHLCRISDRPDYWKCRYCDAREICHPGVDSVALPIRQLSCRQCCHATPDTENGGWFCEKHNCSFDDRTPCVSFLCIPDLVTFAHVDHAADNCIGFKCDKSELSFIHGANGYSGAELITLTEKQLCEKWSNK